MNELSDENTAAEALAAADYAVLNMIGRGSFGMVRADLRPTGSGTHSPAGLSLRAPHTLRGRRREGLSR